VTGCPLESKLAGLQKKAAKDEENDDRCSHRWEVRKKIRPLSKGRSPSKEEQQEGSLYLPAPLVRTE
jgi:hypothetical protein